MRPLKVTFSGLFNALTRGVLIGALALSFAPHLSVEMWRAVVLKFSSVDSRLSEFGRTWMPRTAFPYSAIGQVIQPHGDGRSHLCSGTLVSPCHVLTARHCIDHGSTVYFAHSKDSYSRGRVVAQGSTTGQDGSGQHATDANDWALVELNSHLGDQYGWMDVAKDLAPAKYRALEFQFAGLPGAITSLVPSLKTGIRDVDVQFDDLEKDTKLWTATRLSHGDSGGSLWTLIKGRPVIVGSAVRGLLFREGSFFYPSGEAAKALQQLKCSKLP